MRRARSRRDETGAVALIVALLAVVIFACAALAVDISSLAMERQRLHDHVDSAAHAGAYELPADGAAARTQAINMARTQDPEIDPDVDFFCIVASTGASRSVRSDQIPATCNPGPAPYTPGGYPGLRCNEKICAVPCDPSAGDVCNSIRVTDEKAVPFGFARVIGHNQGRTGAVSSVACKGSCGEESPNPLDVVIMADRTTSMSDANRDLMKTAILDSLVAMSPAMHYVAFGTLHKSRTGASCATAATRTSEGLTGGTWMPIPFSDDYKTASGAINSGSGLVRGVQCLPNSAVPGLSTGSYGTHLASAMKHGARYLLGSPYASNNLSSLPSRPGTPKKVLIFETDGMPDELVNGGSTTLTSTSDLGAGRQADDPNNGPEGCENLLEVAAAAKAQDITIITIGFGDARTARCRKSDDHDTGSSERVREVLAEAASPGPSGPSVADTDCDSTSARTQENTDGDNFYCAASGAELGPIFATAIATVSTGIKLVALP